MLWVKGQSGNAAGRAKGCRNKHAREIEEQARARGMTPLEVMQGTVEHLLRRAAREKEPVKSELRVQAAEIAAKIAPYIHPRLSAVAHTGKDGGPVQHEVRQVPDSVAERILAATGVDVRKAPEETRH